MTLYPNKNEKEVNPNYTPPATTKKRVLIDRGQINYTWWELPDGKYSDGVTLQSVIHSMTPVDAVEVVHGHWKKNWCDNNMIGHEYEECSICGCSMLDTNQFWDSNFCPNCGADMRGEQNDS